MSKKASFYSRLVYVGLLALLGSGVAGAQEHSPHTGPVMNYHRINDRLVTGGHLLDGGAAALKRQGVKVVIDLRDDSPSGEQARFAEQGIEWINIPVKWRSPGKREFDRFSETMREHRDDHVLVQCAANYRASAMTYLFRVVVEKVPEVKARDDLNAVWNPNENDTWREYINHIKTAMKKDDL